MVVDVHYTRQVARCALHEDMKRIITKGMERTGIEGPAALQRKLMQRGCSVHINMVRRWIHGEARPRGVRLEVLLDVLGIMHPTKRRAAQMAAYMPKLGDE